MYDHGDKRVPHIMFFASKSIYALENLTYNYNHKNVRVHGTNDNLMREKGGIYLISAVGECSKLLLDVLYIEIYYILPLH